jgi:ABC-type Zn2+ transport system substrate-binding protein/surface adhesin
MDYIVCTYTWKSRELRKIFVVLLKSWIVENIKKMNYIHNYSLKDDKVERLESQMFVVWTKDKENFIDFLSKNFPQIDVIHLT